MCRDGRRFPCKRAPRTPLTWTIVRLARQPKLGWREPGTSLRVGRGMDADARPGRTPMTTPTNPQPLRLTPAPRRRRFVREHERAVAQLLDLRAFSGARLEVEPRGQSLDRLAHHQRRPFAEPPADRAEVGRRPRAPQPRDARRAAAVQAVEVGERGHELAPARGAKQRRRVEQAGGAAEVGGGDALVLEHAPAHRHDAVAGEVRGVLDPAGEVALGWRGDRGHGLSNARSVAAIPAPTRPGRRSRPRCRTRAPRGPARAARTRSP